MNSFPPFKAFDQINIIQKNSVIAFFFIPLHVSRIYLCNISQMVHWSVMVSLLLILTIGIHPVEYIFFFCFAQLYIYQNQFLLA